MKLIKFLSMEMWEEKKIMRNDKEAYRFLIISLSYH